MATLDHITSGPYEGLDWGYDARPLRAGEAGTGTTVCATCGTRGDCGCYVSCWRNATTYAAHGCGVAGCQSHPNG